LTWLIFTCRAQASRPFESAMVSSLHFNVKLAEADVVDLSSSDTEETLELLSLSPASGPRSPLSKLRSSSGCDLFEDWPKANDMAVSVYILLTAYASSSNASIVDALRGTQKSCTSSSSTR
jgi:hypothetical protein